MQSVAVFVFVIGFVAIAIAHEKSKVCFKSTEGCQSAKALLQNIRAIQIVDPKVDIPRYIGQLQDLFNITLTEQCKVDICKCKNGQLDCLTARDDIRTILENVKLPECLQASAKANVILGNFKKAIAEKDREAILTSLEELNKAVTDALARTDNKETHDCIAAAVLHVRDRVNIRIKSLDVQETCDFCKN